MVRMPPHTETTRSGALKFRRPKKGANLSRKVILEAQRQVHQSKQLKVKQARQLEKRAIAERLQKIHNKRANQTFDRDTLRGVQAGLTAAIEALGEPVTPLALFIGATTALSKTTEKHQIPYLLTIAGVCVPQLSQGMLRLQLQPMLTLCEQLVAENVASNHLISTKAMKLVQRLLLALETPTMETLLAFQRLEPSKLHVESMKMYLVTFRKLLEQSALRADAGPPRRERGVYTLAPAQAFFVEALPLFVQTCINNLTDAPAAVVSTSCAELMDLLRRTLSPVVVESNEGRQMIDALLSGPLLTTMKPLYQRYWSLGLEMLETLFTRLHYLKRTRTPQTPAFTERFPASIFLLKVLNKLRVMDDAKLNGNIERTMVAVGNCMTVQEFTEVIDFDPKAAAEAELYGRDDAEALWSTSYILNVLRRTASHDSLPFFVGHFFPHIQHCSRKASEAASAQLFDELNRWSALLLQYWRLAVGFCHFPHEVTNESFRDLAKQLVGLLGMPQFVNTAATAIHVLCDGYFMLADMEERDAVDGGAPVAHDDDEDDEDDGEAPLEDDQRGAAAKGLRRRRRQHRHMRKDALEDDDFYLSLHDPEWNPHVYHGISQAAAKEVCAIFTRYSANIMPRLCNVFETEDSSAVLLAIQSFSKVCAPSVMTVILKGILDMGSSIASQQEHEQELQAAAGAATRTAGSAPLAAKRRVVLDIACAVVSQLPEEHVTALLSDVIEPVLINPAPESRLLQKKAYKLLFSLFEHRIRDIFPHFGRIVGLLSVGRQHVTVSGMKMRLRCLSWALDACKMFHPEELVATIRTSVGEVILFSRERSGETRCMAMDVLEKMQRYMTAASAPNNALLHLVLAGLSGKTPSMISSALVCMAKIVYLTHQELPDSDLEGAIAIGFQLMESTMAEVRSAASIFARMALKLMKRSPRVRQAVEKALPKLLYSIALITSQPHVSSNTRMQMRVLLEKCIKRFGYEQIDPMFPLGSKNFLRYTQKMLKREQKKEERELKKRDEKQQSEFDRFFLGVSIDPEDAVEEDLLQAGALNSFVSKNAAPLLPGGLGRPRGEEEEEEDEYDAMHLDVQEDGKIRIISREEKTREQELARRQAMADKLLRRHNGLVHADSLNESAVRTVGKRGRNDEAEDFENDELILRYGSTVSAEKAQRAADAFTRKKGGAAAGGGGGGSAVGPSERQISVLRDQKAERREMKRQRVEEDIRKGDTFRGTGDGDVKRGNVDPFAYVPLNRRYMNRRNARQALHRFEVISTSQLKGGKAKAVQEAAAKKR